jgi:hypothetical protein
VLKGGRRGRQHDLRRRIDLVEDRAGRELAHARPLAVGDGHQAQIGQGLHRLADRRTANAEALHQLAFGWQGVAGAQVAAGDHRLQPIQHFVGELSANDRVKGHRHHSMKACGLGTSTRMKIIPVGSALRQEGSARSRSGPPDFSLRILV